MEARRRYERGLRLGRQARVGDALSPTDSFKKRRIDQSSGSWLQVQISVKGANLGRKEGAEEIKRRYRE